MKCYNEVTMRDAIVKYIITLKDRKKLADELATKTYGDYSKGRSEAISDIIAELEGFVKSGGYEDLMKQALMEAYGHPSENAGDAMVKAATAAGLKDVRIDEEEWVANYKKWEAGR